MKIEIPTSIENNQFKRNRNLVLNAIKFFNNKDVVISFAKLSKKRTNPQNNYYWGCILPLVQNGLLEQTGEFLDMKAIHYDILLKLFAPNKEIANKNTGEVINMQITSSGMTTTQFCQYIKDIQKWGAEFLYINIPDPNDELNFDFRE